jgi:phosphoribosylformimino-5-aminoimidazole carboxamide ribotide isomerase
MKIIPAIDIINGQCVRLTKGDYGQKKVYDNDPVEVAQTWQDQGAELIHLVDLDGAKAGHPCNFEVIKRLKKQTNCALEIGGGIRTLAHIEQYLDIGIERLILGTVIFKEPKLLEQAAHQYAQNIIIGLDIKDGQPAVSGWQDVVELDFAELLQKFQNLNLNEIIFTVISRDGMLQGCDLAAIETLLQKWPGQVIASGGVTSSQDITGLLALNEKYNQRISGAIVGKALYEKKTTLPVLIDLV